MPALQKIGAGFAFAYDSALVRIFVAGNIATLFGPFRREALLLDVRLQFGESQHPAVHEREIMQIVRDNVPDHAERECQIGVRLDRDPLVGIRGGGRLPRIVADHPRVAFRLLRRRCARVTGCVSA
jgi:hypothetical protein